MIQLERLKGMMRERESDEVYLSYFRFYFFSFMIDLARIKTMIQSGEAYLAFIMIHFC